MARARNIKPGVMTNEDLAECDYESRLLYIYLWMLADRAGRLEDRPKRISAQAFPYDNIDLERCLSQLDSYGFLHRYEVNNVKYIEIVNFGRHQNPHIREKGSTIPAPDHDSASTGQAQGQHDTSTSPAPPDSLIPDSLIPDSGGVKPKTKTARGSRLPPDWKLTCEYRLEAKKIRPDWPDDYISEVADKFADYWHSKSGNTATKVDWQATWRNWCRNENSPAVNSKTKGPSGPVRDMKPMRKPGQRQRHG